MTVRRTYLALIAAAALGVIATPKAEATYVVTFKQIGANVVELGSGALDTTDLSKGTSVINNVPLLAPVFGDFQSGAANDPLALFGFALGPASFGPNGFSAPSSSGGDVGIRGDGDIAALLLPPAYVSGTQLAEFSVYADASFASLGMIPGVYVWSWGLSAHADTFRIEIVAGSGPRPIPEPSTWAMMLVGFAGLGYAALRRKGAVGAISA